MKCREEIEKAKPQLKIKIVNDSFKLNKWHKVGMSVENDGDAPATNIRLAFSDDVAITYRDHKGEEKKVKRIVWISVGEEGSKRRGSGG